MNLGYVGEADRSSPVGVSQSYIRRVDLVIRDILKLSFARFNIYIMNKRLPVHWTSVRCAEIHDLEQQN
jgi:RNA-binding protein YlmH